MLKRAVSEGQYYIDRYCWGVLAFFFFFCQFFEASTKWWLLPHSSGEILQTTSVVFSWPTHSFQILLSWSSEQLSHHVFNRSEFIELAIVKCVHIRFSVHSDLSLPPLSFSESPIFSSSWLSWLTSHGRAWRRGPTGTGCSSSKKRRPCCRKELQLIIQQRRSAEDVVRLEEERRRLEEEIQRARATSAQGATERCVAFQDSGSRGYHL